MARQTLLRANQRLHHRQDRREAALELGPVTCSAPQVPSPASVLARRETEHDPESEDAAPFPSLRQRLSTAHMEPLHLGNRATAKSPRPPS